MIVVGRDAREWYAAGTLHGRGHDVVYVGHVPSRGTSWPHDPPSRKDLAEALDRRPVCVGPIRGFEPDQEQTIAGLLPGMPEGGLLMVGRPGRTLSEVALIHGIRVIDVLGIESFAVLNAVPTAEGAIVEALLAGEKTIWQSRSLVTGFGRVGRTLSERLQALGASVEVFSREPAERALAQSLGCAAYPLTDLPDRLPKADFLFNTIPARVFGSVEIDACPRDAVLIDLASPPGGFDRAALDISGLKFRHVLGIPGRLTPQTAGRILADTLEELLREMPLPAGASALPRERASRGRS